MHSALLSSWSFRDRIRCVLHPQRIYTLGLEADIKITQGKGKLSRFWIGDQGRHHWAGSSWYMPWWINRDQCMEREDGSEKSALPSPFFSEPFLHSHGLVRIAYVTLRSTVNPKPSSAQYRQDVRFSSVMHRAHIGTAFAPHCHWVTLAEGDPLTL